MGRVNVVTCKSRLALFFQFLRMPTVMQSISQPSTCDLNHIDDFTLHLAIVSVIQKLSYG